MKIRNVEIQHVMHGGDHGGDRTDTQELRQQWLWLNQRQ
jgi:hypothetical protein